MISMVERCLAPLLLLAIRLLMAEIFFSSGLLKNRNGPTSYVDLYFYKQWLRFEDMLDPDR